MSEIISPMSGVKQSFETEVKVHKPKKKKIKKATDELIPIISPFYGPSENIKEEQEIEKVVEKEEPRDEYKRQERDMIL